MLRMREAETIQRELLMSNEDELIEFSHGHECDDRFNNTLPLSRNSPRAELSRRHNRQHGTRHVLYGVKPAEPTQSIVCLGLNECPNPSQFFFELADRTLFL
jgi:hypothetical protein